MAASQARICCWVWFSLAANASHGSFSKAAAQTHTRNISPTELLGERRLADVIHEFEQVLPALAPEAGLHVTQEDFSCWLSSGRMLVSGSECLSPMSRRRSDTTVSFGYRLMSTYTQREGRGGFKVVSSLLNT
ncbi:hypothetical protein EYF80_004379 [Liparis tanakae]|uniref:Uncharacterized protein n=1 Tax=Liparis tanakae TaxID=230148 RepID=A0A4Z2J5R7_9TELE|nr:hypothetical protein EYF80_004379 [Liparis tanakae]